MSSLVSRSETMSSQGEPGKAAGCLKGEPGEASECLEGELGEASECLEGEPGEASEYTSDPPTSPHDNISQHLQQDILGADFLVSLFWAAMNSFRHDSILRPFPSAYVQSVESERSEGGREVEGEKDIEGLVSRCDEVPSQLAMFST